MSAACQGEFAPACLPRMVALVTTVSQAGYAFAPAAFGLLRAAGGEAAMAGGAPLLFAMAALIQLLSAGALLLGRAR